MNKEEFGNGWADGHFYTMESVRMLLDFILVGGMTLAVLLVLLILKTRKGLSQKLPAIFFAVGFFFMLYYYAFLHKSNILGGTAILFGHGLGYLVGPVILFYIRSLTFPSRTVGKSLVIQLIPYFFHWTFLSFPLALSVFNVGFFEKYGSFLAGIADWTNLVENFYLLFYCVLSLRETNRMRALYKENYSSLDQKRLEWCKLMVSGIIGIVFIDSFLSIYELVFPPVEVIFNIGTITAFGLILLFAFLGYRGMLQNPILLPEFLLERSPSIDSISRESSAQSLWNFREAEEAKQRLLRILDREKPYLDESLTLGDLAARMDITDKRLSELLNKHLDTNFYDLINTYRVESVKEKMADSSLDHLTLLALGFESGFKSKTSFNRVFKQKTGMSPSEYKKEVLLNHAVRA